MINDPIKKTITLVEDRISELFETGILDVIVLSPKTNLPSDEYILAKLKLKFLKTLSYNLTKFDLGDY